MKDNQQTTLEDFERRVAFFDPYKNKTCCFLEDN